MSKLYRLRRWLELDQAAAAIGEALGERFETSDLIKLALEGRITLSVYLPEIEEGWEYAERDKSQIGGGSFIDLDSTGSMVYQLQKADFVVEAGLWQLPLWADANRRHFRNLLQRVYSKPLLESSILEYTEGIVLQRMKCLVQLRAFREDEWGDEEGERWLHAIEIPEHALTVVEANELEKFIESLLAGVNEDIPKPLGNRERETLLKLVIGMAIGAYGHNPAAKKTDTVTQIVDDLARAGAPLSDETVRKYLKEAASLLSGSRHKV
jgi:hypothetical protein